jgi:hypothetical protein
MQAHTPDRALPIKIDINHISVILKQSVLFLFSARPYDFSHIC